MVSIFQAKTSDFHGKIPLKNLLSKLPASFHARALRYRFEKDAFDFVLGRLLLEKGLSDLGIDNSIENIQIDQKGKPFLDHCYFNISHTGGLVVCAISTEYELGIDIEYRKEVNLADFEAWFTDFEWQDIQSANIPLERFFWYWTRKESIIKALGWSLSDLNQLPFHANEASFMQNEQKWYLQDLDFGTDYWACLCSPSLDIEML